MEREKIMRTTTYIVKYGLGMIHGMTDEGYIYRKLSSDYFKHDVPLLALNEYKPDSHGEDDFSRKQAWFYTYGDGDIKEEFEEMFVDLINHHFVEDEMEWDLMTQYPTHIKGNVNPNMRDLMMDVASETGISLEQVLKRTQNIQESHELEDEKAKVVNVKGSIDIDRDLDGKNIILVDNITLSGTSLLHGANRLKQNGADNVFALCIGTNSNGKGIKRISRDKTASELL